MTARRDGQIRFFKGTGIGSCKSTIHVNGNGSDYDRIVEDVTKRWNTNDFDMIEIGHFAKWEETRSLETALNTIKQYFF
jgi:hypothetical protein